jgi:hypothetical protein
MLMDKFILSLSCILSAFGLCNSFVSFNNCLFTIFVDIVNLNYYFIYKDRW